ncbi:Serine/arginine-rich splicing factor SR45a [Zea mays]|uniref:Serine/arginine-rich splicing factor SR45a n=2 Tax=Zea mays TaxID=4577 RepID=A0A1D6EBG6_MAIZE|nr:Serine/arginine-rich splicing factor SR45a [Zea mays]
MNPSSKDNPPITFAVAACETQDVNVIVLPVIGLSGDTTMFGVGCFDSKKSTFLSERYGSRSPYSNTRYIRMWTQVMLKTLGNNLYVTVLSPCVTDQGLKKHFSTEGEVIDASIVYDPWTREPRGFGFVTMAATKEADHCIKYLDCSVLQGQVIIVEKNILLFCLHHRESEIASHSLHIHKVLLDCDDVQADALIVDRLASL